MIKYFSHNTVILYSKSISNRVSFNICQKNCLGIFIGVGGNTLILIIFFLFTKLNILLKEV